MPARVLVTPVTTWTRESAASTKTRKARVLDLLNQLLERWNSVQVGRQGSYSVERLESLDHYCKTTSPTRVLLVCILTPIPALSFALLLECLPLRPPSEGWAANSVFWIRLSLMVFGLTYIGISEMILFLPNLEFTIRKRLIVTIGSAGPYVTCVLLAMCFGFPVPFVWQYCGLILVVYLAAMILIVFGRQAFGKGSHSRHHFRRFFYHLLAYCTMVTVYPLYELVYTSTPEGYRGYALIALPLWKFGAKHFVMLATRELEDFLPQIVAFNVDFFSALFVSVCISSGGSVYLSMMFIAVDVGQCLLEFQEVRANAKTVLKLLQRKVKAQYQLTGELVGKPTANNNVVAMLLAVTRNPEAFLVEFMPNVRLWGCLPHPIPKEKENALKTLKGLGAYAESKFISRRRTSRFRSHRQWLAPRLQQQVAIVPKPTALGSMKVQVPAIRSDLGDTSQAFVCQGLRLLFHGEYLLLVEYVECIVPVIFATYKSVLKYPPNVVYYPGGVGNWGQTALINIFVFTLLEIGSLLLLHHFFKRNFALSSFYQLAFVLEAQMYSIQATIFLEIVVLLQYKLEHLGADFSFRFEWLHVKT